MAKSFGRSTQGTPDFAQTDFDFYDTTLHRGTYKSEIDLAGSVRYLSNFNSIYFGMYSATYRLEPRQAVIIAGQIGAYEKEHEWHPLLMSIVLANYHGRILAICPGAPHQGGPDATTHVFGRPLSLNAIRIKISYYLGTQNILVGFHLG